MSIKSQGTKVYFVDSITAPATPVVARLVCVGAVSGIGGGKADQIETTCLEALNREFVSGLASPAEYSIPYNFDPRLVSHKLLNQLKASDDKIEWMICLSDGTAEPTLTGGVLTAPTGRTSVKFTAYVSENTMEIAQNDVVKGTLTLQRSGAETWVYKAV